jgi:hypothetical protein
MRSLIYVPIIHSESELGTLGDVIRRRFEEAYGARAAAAREPSVDAMWTGLRRRLTEMALPWKRTRIYQDGLPVCGREQDIARDVAMKGSKNYEIVLELMERGATLMGTEDPDLMVQEYRRIQALVRIAASGAPHDNILELKRDGDELLRKRDRFIAQRIQATLGQGETGILFIGLLHRVDELLGPGLHVQHLIHNLPLKADIFRRLEN